MAQKHFFTEKTATGLNVDQITRIRAYSLYLELDIHAYPFIRLYKVQNDYRSQLKILISKANGIFHVKLTKTLKNPLKSKC
jgi:hypothetical protein